MTNERPTPETDAAAEEVGMGHFMVDADFARKLERERAEAWACCDELVVDSNAITLAKTVMRLERERDELLQWKKETLLVESQWDEQAVGRLLGLRLGDFIKPNIEPKLRQLIKERDEAREVASGLAKQAERLRKERDETRSRVEIITPHENTPVAEFFSSPNS